MVNLKQYSTYFTSLSLWIMTYDIYNIWIPFPQDIMDPSWTGWNSTHTTVSDAHWTIHDCDHNDNVQKYDNDDIIDIDSTYTIVSDEHWRASYHDHTDNDYYDVYPNINTSCIG